LLPKATFGRAVYAACQWGIISLLARLGSPEIVGEYALGVAIAGPLLLLAQRKSGSARANDIRVLSLGFALLGIAAVGFLERSVQDRLVILIVVMAQAVEWVAEIYSANRNALSLVSHGCCSIVALAIFSNVSGRVTTGLLGVLVVRLLLLFLYDFRRPPRSQCDAGRETLLASFAPTIPCYFIAHMMGYRWLGIYAAIASLLPAVDVLAEAVAEEAAPDLARLFTVRDAKAYSRMTLELAASGLLLGLGTVAMAMTVGPRVLIMLFGPEYVSQAPVLIVLAGVAASGIVATVLGNRSQDSIALEITVIAAVAVASLVLVARYGLIGAAVAAGVGYLTRAVGEVRSTVAVARRC
jgi:hypothetical protein